MRRRTERIALIGLLLGTAALYLWDLGASGWANSFYSAAAQAGSANWEAFFFGSSDAGNSITVDKPPASIWIMALSVRLFGLSAWSILVPEALMGVATVFVLYLALRRRFSAGIALLGGALLALTPVAALMFRFNNPDALLVLLLTLGAYFTIRAVEDGRLRWVLWAGAMIGLGFLTKQLQAFLLLPVLAGVYLWAAPGTWKRRIGYSFAALGAVLVSAGWWVAVVELVPAAWRPYVGGSQTNSFLELTFGYNGFGRLTGAEVGSVGGGRPGGWGDTGILRLVSGDTAGQVSWLLPAALILAVVGLVLLRRAPRTSVRRATLVLFTGWMLVTGLAFSFMEGIFHAYYTVALAPAIAAVVAIGCGQLWARRAEFRARVVAAAVILVTGLTAFLVLRLVAGWMPWLGFVAPALAVIAALLLLLPPRGRAGTVATATVALGALLLAPAAYAAQTVATPHSGSIVTAGPAVSGISAALPPSFHPANGGQRPPAGGLAGGQGQVPGGQRPGGQGMGPGSGAGPRSSGGLLDAAAVSGDVAAMLADHASDYTWVAAAVGSQRAAGYQLATQLPVMPVGGFNGSDPSPTLAEFQQLVADGRIHYFIAGSVGRSNGGASSSSQIAAWVENNFTAQQMTGAVLYDLTS
ncbi:MAG TPA: glycosyltransferase family 39 protein [Pseudolysinimonas sp.]|nr:glycosyltransferase family 39 protein [Pseudolysinimonas sp.]